MQTDAKVLASNASGAAAGSEVQWSGGRSSLVINATTYPATCKLQLQGPSKAWINIDPADFTADGVYTYDLPAGTYRMNMASGTVAALYATLVKIPYG